MSRDCFTRCFERGTPNVRYVPATEAEMLTQKSLNSHVACSETWNMCACPCPPWAPFEHLDLRVFRVCRQLYNEGNQVMWTTNTFAFDDPKPFRLFMRTPSHIQKQLLSKIYMRQQCFQIWNGTISKTILNAFKSLRVVHIVIERGKTEFSVPFGRKLFGQIKTDFDDHIGNTNILFRSLGSLSEASIVIKRWGSYCLEKPATMRRLRDIAKRAEQMLLVPHCARTHGSKRVTIGTRTNYPDTMANWMKTRALSRLATSVIGLFALAENFRTRSVEVMVDVEKYNSIVL